MTNIKDSPSHSRPLTSTNSHFPRSSLNLAPSVLNRYKSHAKQINSAFWDFTCFVLLVLCWTRFSIEIIKRFHRKSFKISQDNTSIKVNKIELNVTRFTKIVKCYKLLEVLFVMQSVTRYIKRYKTFILKSVCRRERAQESRWRKTKFNWKANSFRRRVWNF